jgi:hypothetical protein
MRTAAGCLGLARDSWLLWFGKEQQWAAGVQGQCRLGLQLPGVMLLLEKAEVYVMQKCTVGQVAKQLKLMAAVYDVNYIF